MIKYSVLTDTMSRVVSEMSRVVSEMSEEQKMDEKMRTQLFTYLHNKYITEPDVFSRINTDTLDMAIRRTAAVYILFIKEERESIQIHEAITDFDLKEIYALYNISSKAEVTGSMTLAYNNFITATHNKYCSKLDNEVSVGYLTIDIGKSEDIPGIIDNTNKLLLLCDHATNRFYWSIGGTSIQWVRIGVNLFNELLNEVEVV